MRTLLVHPGSLGDVLISLSLVERIEGEVWIAARAPALGLRGLAPRVARWIDLDGALGPALLGERNGDPPRDLASVDHIVVLRADPTGDVARRVEQLGRGAVVVASARPPEGVAARAHVARVLGVSDGAPATPWIAGRLEQRAHTGLVVHPGSGGRAKRWPIEAFAEVLRGAERSFAAVEWVLGAAELEDGVEPPPGTRVLGDPSLPVLASRLAEAAAYLGCDSGVSHLAAAVGTPSVLVFGPTDPARWAPVAPWVLALRGDGRVSDGRWGLDPGVVREALIRVSARSPVAPRDG